MDVERGNRSRATKELHVAPMMAVTYRDYRFLARILTKRAVLWTEMVVDDTLVFGEREKVKNHYLEFDREEHPVVCQIGSSGFNLDWTQQASVMVENSGYDELNLNAECPSNKVAVRRQFGAALMEDVEGATKILNTMRCVDMPVSIKMRIAINNIEADDFLFDYVDHLVKECSCYRFYLHSRKVFTDGRYRPLQNRNVPPLNFPVVYRLCQQFPDCDFWVNGGIRTLEHAKAVCFGLPAFECTCDNSVSPVQSGHGAFPCEICNEKNGSCIAPPAAVPPNLRGCLIGRAAMENPAILADVDRYFYGELANPTQNRREVIVKYADYLSRRYPKRCCDSNPRVSTVDVPIILDLIHDHECHICGKNGDKDMQLDASNSASTKIPKALIDYALKPILGMFYGVKKGPKLWRNICHDLSSTKAIWNCGPSYILHCAILQMNDDLLDQAFQQCE